jgi:hypothetical protein
MPANIMSKPIVSDSLVLFFMLIVLIVIDDCFLFDGVAKATSTYQGGEGIEHELGDVFAKKLFGYPTSE